MPLHRRTFLLAGLAGTLRGAGDRPRIAFLGGAHVHSPAKASLVRDSSDWDFAGIAEPDPKLLAAYTERGVRALSREQILADRTITVVAVESAVKDHAADALAALEAGKHVHVEKPAAHTIEGMRRLVDAARARRLLLQSGYMWRYHPAFERALEAARKGWLGRVYLVRGQIHTTLPPEQRAANGEFAGGQMFELGAHLIDAVVRLLGRPEKVTPFLRGDGGPAGRLMDNTLAVLEYPQAMAVIQSSAMQPHASAHRSFEILGENGTATIRPLEPASLEIDLARPAGPYIAGRQTVELPRYERYAADLAELAGAVRGEKALRVSLDEEFVVEETLLRASAM